MNSEKVHTVFGKLYINIYQHEDKKRNQLHIKTIRSIIYKLSIIFGTYLVIFLRVFILK